MPDREAPVSLAQHSFATGEVSPGFYGRQDIQKYGSGCAVLRNFYVDPRGGATVRPGTQFLGYPATPGYARLIPFQFSPDIGQSYILVFSAGHIRFIKNPGTASYPNGSNAGFIQSGGVDYDVLTPYTEADLRRLRYVQMADVMWIACHGRIRMKLSRLADDNWTLLPISSTPMVTAPVMSSVTVSPAATGVTPAPAVETRYMYCVSAVNANGEESLPAVPMVSDAGINIAVTQGTVTVRWTAAPAAYFKVWKALPAHGNRVPLPNEQFGFVGYSYGVEFTDSNIVPDFAQAPISAGDPFAPGALTGYAISNAGSGYLPGATTITVTDTTGTGAVVYPVMGSNIAGTAGGIVGLYIANPGRGYTAPTATAVGAGSGFAATFTVGPSTGLEPGAVGIFQQRLVYAATDKKPISIFASRPDAPDDFRTSNPTVDSDSFQFDIFDRQVSHIYWMYALPGGLLIGTNAAVMQLTGGSSTAGNPTAVTPTNAVIVPQSQFGSADVEPILIDHDILYVQREGTPRSLIYNFYANIYAGKDITVLSNHFFAYNRIVEWVHQDIPSKIVWAVLDTGTLLSLTYLKEEEVLGWARHDTPNGIVESIATVQEGESAVVYFSVLRFGSRWIERQAQQQFFQASDAWQLDGALSTVANYPNCQLDVGNTTGTQIAIASAPIFLPGHVGYEIHAVGSRGTVVEVTSPTQILLEIDPARPFFAQSLYPGLWRLDPVVNTVTGLAHMEGTTVYALVNGVAQGPFTVTGGAITLTTPGSQVVVGYKFQAQLQPLYVETPEAATIQGKRKKVAAASVRVRNAQGLKYGPSFTALNPWSQGTSSTDEQPLMPYGAFGLYSGDQRIWLDQVFSIGGWVCVQQDDPYPATVISIMPELAQGDVM